MPLVEENVRKLVAVEKAVNVRHGVTLAELPGSVRDELECDVEDLLIDAYGTGATSSLVDRIMETIERAESADQSDDSGC
jgi:hypothetical protein